MHYASPRAVGEDSNILTYQVIIVIAFQRNRDQIWKMFSWKVSTTDVNERDSARILLHAGRPISGVCVTTEPFVKRTRIIRVMYPRSPKLVTIATTHKHL